MLEESVALLLAQQLAEALTKTYHDQRVTLPCADVDQLREYTVRDSGDYFSIVFRNGFDAGKPSIHSRMDKKTGTIYSGAYDVPTSK